jgi:hypothetical protein
VIWDCIMFAGELDVLECRLESMAPYCVQHIIVECDVDNNGNSKPYTLGEAWDSRFSRWLSRVTYTKVSGLPGPAAWDREHQQRDEAMRVLRALAHPGDWVLAADVDEIPPPELLRHPRAGVLMMRNMMLSVDRALPEPQPTAVMVQWPFEQTLSAVRDSRYGMHRIEPGGWHLSWLGGEEAVQRKLAMHCHPWSDTDVLVRQLVPNDDMPPWCREHAPPEWWKQE